MLPSSLESKLMKPYLVKFGSSTVKVDVIHPKLCSDSLLIKKLSEFKRQLNPERRVVGIGFKYSMSSYHPCCWLLLCVGDRGLMIKIFPEMMKADSKIWNGWNRLMNILNDQSLCFVGVDTDPNNQIRPLLKRQNYTILDIKALAKIDCLVARLRQKPALLSCSLQMLAAEVGLDVKPKTTTVTTFNGQAEVFSEEEVKSAIHDVYYSYLIADKLISGC